MSACSTSGSARVDSTEKMKVEIQLFVSSYTLLTPSLAQAFDNSGHDGADESFLLPGLIFERKLCTFDSVYF